MLDSDQLPEGPLTMAGLVALDSAPLRRLLKNGLRRGISRNALQQQLRDDWSLELDSAEAGELLERLAARGWFRCSSNGEIWKTHLGS